jgi:hypothetical protein
VLPTSAGGFIVFRDGMPNNEGTLATGFRTEDEAHAALVQIAAKTRKKGKP